MQPWRATAISLPLLALTIAAAGLALHRGSVSAGSFVPGDATCDGQTNSIDASVILQYDAGLIQVISCPENADANGDGQINSLDSAIILQYDAGLIDHIGSPATNTPTRTRTPTRTPNRTNTPIPPQSTPTSMLPPPSPTSTPESEDDFALGLVDGCYDALLDWTELTSSEASTFCVENKGTQEAADTLRDFALTLVLSEEITYELGYCMGFTAIKSLVLEFTPEETLDILVAVCFPADLPPTGDFDAGLIDGCYDALLDWTDFTSSEASAFCAENMGTQDAVDTFRDFALTLVSSEEITYGLGYCMGFTTLKSLVLEFTADETLEIMTAVCFG